MSTPAETFDPLALALVLAQLDEVDPEHELLVAARLALDIAAARRVERRALREAALDVHAARTPAQWRRWAQHHAPFEELQRRRGEERGPDGQWRAIDRADRTRTDTGDAA
ncbi:hypothetical protein BJF90_39340 [Pseudonocardia sp. CNS-004]|nr:hypothetical protein BJF90_39340 [Pseudonocardia sp. CNS-004]